MFLLHWQGDTKWNGSVGFCLNQSYHGIVSSINSNINSWRLYNSTIYELCDLYLNNNYLLITWIAMISFGLKYQKRSIINLNNKHDNKVDTILSLLLID